MKKPARSPSRDIRALASIAAALIDTDTANELLKLSGSLISWPLDRKNAASVERDMARHAEEIAVAAVRVYDALASQKR